MCKLTAVLTALFFLLADLNAQQGNNFEYTDTVLKAGQIHVVPGIFWEIEGGVRLRPESKTYMDTLILFLKKHSDFSYEIGVHDDIRLPQNFTRQSKIRADSIVAFLKSKGVTNIKITPKGYGNSQPVVTEETAGRKLTEQEHQCNRRTVLKIIAVKKTNPYFLIFRYFKISSYKPLSLEYRA